MTARVKGQAVLVLIWIVVTTSATAMAWWSVTFVTAAVADRRPLRPSDVVAASVHQTVPVPVWVHGPQPVGPPPERTVSPVPAVVVQAVNSPPAQPSIPAVPSVPASKGSVARLVLVAERTAVTHVAAAVPVAVVPPTTVKPPPPVPAPRTTQVADLPVASAAGLAYPAESAATVAVKPDRSHWRGSPSSHHSDQQHPAQVAPAWVGPDASAAAAVVAPSQPRHQSRHSTHCDRVAPSA